jgi:hypothetical protein
MFTTFEKKDELLDGLTHPTDVWCADATGAAVRGGRVHLQVFSRALDALSSPPTLMVEGWLLTWLPVQFFLAKW